MKYPQYNAETDEYVYKKDDPILLRLFGKTTLTSMDRTEVHDAAMGIKLNIERQLQEMEYLLQVLSYMDGWGKDNA